MTRNSKCPLFKTGCTTEVLNIRHHLRNRHKIDDKDRIDKLLRPLRYKLAMRALKALRSSKRERLQTDLDLLFEEGELAEQVPPPNRCQNRTCKAEKKELEHVKKVNGLLRKELTKLQRQVQTFSKNV